MLSTQAGKLATEKMSEGASLKRGVICSAELARGLGGLTSCLEATGWGWEVLLLSGDYRVGLGGLNSCLETTGWGVGGLTSCLETTGWGVGGLTSCLETTGFALGLLLET